MPKPIHEATHISEAYRGVVFHTANGVSVPAVTAAEMRELDRIAVEETGPSLSEMMEKAGRNLALFAIGGLGREWRSARVAVLGGAGNNGGGGICAARYLKAYGIQVELCLVAPHRLAGVPALQRALFRGEQGVESSLSQIRYSRFDLVIDALIGYGLRSAPRGPAAELIDWANASEAPIISLDVPSGLAATTGHAPGIAIQAGATLTLVLPKTGLRPEYSGELYLADIGIPETVCRRVAPSYVRPFPGEPWVHLETGAPLQPAQGPSRRARVRS